MFDKAQLRGKSLPASMLLDCKYRNFLSKMQHSKHYFLNTILSANDVS